MMDAETEAFAADVLESLNQAKRGECARAHSPEDMGTHKARGSPVGGTKRHQAAVTVRYSPISQPSPAGGRLGRGLA